MPGKYVYPPNVKEPSSVEAVLLDSSNSCNFNYFIHSL